MAEIDRNRWGVVYSSRSGFLKSRKRWTRICKYMDQRGVQYDAMQSELHGNVERLVTMLCERGYRTIVIVGGDAALNDAVNSLMRFRRNLPEDFGFAVIPNGIGNDFARFWDVSLDDYKRVIDGVIERNIRKIDVGCCKYMGESVPHRRYFLNCVNIGLGARLVKITNEMSKYVGSNVFTFIWAMINNTFERKHYKMNIQIETENLKSRFMTVCIGNAFGYGQTPNAVPYNGLLDVSVVTCPKWWQLFEGFWLLGKGHFLNYRNVHPYRATHVLVYKIDKANVSTDGKILVTKDPAPMAITVEKEALNFIVPAFMEG